MRSYINPNDNSRLFRLIPAATFSSTQPRAAKIKLNAAGDEYLLIENRQPIEYDRQIAAGTDSKVGGLAIWHIDMKKVCGPEFYMTGHQCYL
jgi:hypothetical protein